MGTSVPAVAVGARALAFLLVPALFFRWESSEAIFASAEGDLASLPPRGWNSYDSFSWVVDETAFLQNAEVVARRLKRFGYEYVVVDYLWYRKNVPEADWDSYGYDKIDEWGRLVPDPDRWPSSVGGNGFKEVARKVHDMGLKFGIHVMRGISMVAFNANTPILDVSKSVEYAEAGRVWRAKDIGLKDMTCNWMKNGFMSVNTDLEAGRAFLRSLYQQYAEWGVDFVKLDCVFGEDLDAKEIVAVSELLEELDRPVLLSISPGTSVTTSMAEGISNHVNMYRITGDDWDTWGDVAAHFDISRDFAAAKKIGAQGLQGRSWPDLDMLPLGWLTDPGVRQGPHRKCKLTLDEQRTQMTLWSMAKSPLMFGGDLRHIDDTTFDLITNPTLLEINSYSTNNTELPHGFVREDGINRNRALTQSVTSQEHATLADRKVLHLVSCSDKKANGWFIAASSMELDRICWKFDMKGTGNVPYCLYRRHEETTYQQKHQGNFQLVPRKAMTTCLDASMNKKRTASQITSVSVSACKNNANQIWRLNDNGTLVSSFSGLCAKIRPEKDADNAEAGGARSWIATGRRGEIYAAFFNMNSEQTEISVSLGDLAKVIDSSFWGKGSRNCTEVWGGQHLGLVTDTLSAVVKEHGTVLFILNCSTSNE